MSKPIGKLYAVEAVLAERQACGALCRSVAARLEREARESTDDTEAVMLFFALQRTLEIAYAIEDRGAAGRPG